MDKAGVSVVSASEDEEVIVHPTDHPKVGELEHFVHDPHHLHIDRPQTICYFGQRFEIPVEGVLSHFFDYDND